MPRTEARRALSEMASASGPLLAVEGVGVVFGRHVVLDRVDCSVSAGEILTVIGPNGAGKSTLIKVVLGLIKPTQGVVRRRPGIRFGYLPQSMPIDPVLPLTVFRLMRLTARPSRAEACQALEETGVGRLIDAPIRTLSGGEYQRVLLARALVRDPDLLVLDEPVQGVDFAGEAALYELIGEIRRHRGCGVLMVSHDIHVVMAATDRVLCLNRHVCCAGEPEVVSRHPEYVRLFGPRVAQAFAVYTHHHDHAHAVSGEVLPLVGATGGHETHGSRAKTR